MYYDYNIVDYIDRLLVLSGNSFGTKFIWHWYKFIGYQCQVDTGLMGGGDRNCA